MLVFRLQRVEQMSANASGLENTSNVSDIYQPNPNNPMEFSSTILTSGASAEAGGSPSAVAPISVLKRPDGPGTPGASGSTTATNGSNSGDAKQVGILRGCRIHF